MSPRKSKRPKRLQEKKWDPLTTAYADLSSPEWDGKPVPQDFWTDFHNHKRYFQWLAIQLGINEQDDWYQVTDIPRSVAWDVGKDVTSLARAINFSALIFPLSSQDTNPFFINSARQISSAVLESFIKTCGPDWTFSDFVYTTTDRKRTEAILSRDDWGKTIMQDCLRADKTGDDVFSTLATTMSRYRPVAALWDRCEHRLSIRDWLKSNSVLMIGYNKTVQETLDLVNEMVFTIAVEEISVQPNSATRRSYFVFDEARYAGPLLKSNLIPYLATNGRKKGVSLMIGIQDYEGFQEAAGEKVASEIVAQCSSKALLRFESHDSAVWASKIIGQHEVIETNRSENTTAMSHSISEQSKLKDLVLPSEFYGIKETNPQNGLTGYFISPSIGASKRTIKPEEVAQVVVSSEKEIEHAIQLRDEDQQWFSENFEDQYRRRIKLELKQAQVAKKNTTKLHLRKRPKHPTSRQAIN